MKQYDRQDPRFKELMKKGLNDFASVLFCAVSSTQALHKVQESLGEKIKPAEILDRMDPLEQLENTVNGYLNMEDGLITKEEGLKDAKAFIAAQVRRAVTQALAERKKQTA